MQQSCLYGMWCLDSRVSDDRFYYVEKYKGSSVSVGVEARPPTPVKTSPKKRWSSRRPQVSGVIAPRPPEISASATEGTIQMVRDCGT